MNEITLNGIGIIPDTKWVVDGVANNEALSQFANFSDAVANLVAIEKDMKNGIKKAMEDNGIVSIETERINVKYIDASGRERFDSKAFRKDNPKLYDEYVKFTKVSPSIRVTTKDIEDEA